MHNIERKKLKRKKKTQIFDFTGAEKKQFCKDLFDMSKRIQELLDLKILDILDIDYETSNLNRAIQNCFGK